MRYMSGTKEINIEAETIVSIGKFDGRHTGHQKLLQEMLRIKERSGYQTVVFTFDLAPAALVMKTPQRLLTTNQERRNHMEKMGIDILVEYPFNEQVSQIAPEQFVEEILVGQLHAKAIVVGTDCGFGYRRQGNAALLRQLADVYGYELVVIDKKQDGFRDISSTYVKEELERGNVEKANQLLGEPYSIHGYVQHGNHIGGPKLGFPTANLIPPAEKYLPPFGVYVSKVLIDGRYYGGVTNIGRKPSVAGENPVGVETYIFEFTADLYGKMIEVQLQHFIRPERRFDSLKLLKQQIALDKELALDLLKPLLD